MAKKAACSRSRPGEAEVHRRLEVIAALGSAARTGAQLSSLAVTGNQIAQRSTGADIPMRMQVAQHGSHSRVVSGATPVELADAALRAMRAVRVSDAVGTTTHTEEPAPVHPQEFTTHAVSMRPQELSVEGFALSDEQMAAEMGVQ